MIFGVYSKETFIRVYLENGYMKNYYSDDKKLLYKYVKDEARYTINDTITHTEEWISPIDGETDEGHDLKYKKGEWKFWEKDLNKKRKNGHSYYYKILAEVKSEYTLFEIE